MADGLFGVGSPVQKRLGIDADKEKLFKIAMDYAHWTINPWIVRVFIEKSGDTIRWLEENGLKFEVRALYPGQVHLVWHIPEGRGAAVTKFLSKRCQELDVPLLCKTTAKRILTDRKGKLTGVLASKGDKEFKISVKSVIIATGGYGGNKDLLKKYCPSYSENMVCSGLPHMGDGLTMATKIGGATEGLGIIHLAGARFQGSAYVRALSREPQIVLLNKKGERFTDEAITFNTPEYANTVYRQPDKVVYALFDSKIKQGIIQSGFQKFPQLIKTTELEEQLRLETDKGKIKIADSWDEIARWIGTKSEALKTTVGEYNSLCDQQCDKVFGKEKRYLVALRTPPYYAIKCYSSYLGTIGGIKINQRMEVLNHKDNPIPGLYAVGADTGGWESDTYCAILSGSAFGFAINSGRIAGENAVKYLSGK